LQDYLQSLGVNSVNRSIKLFRQLLPGYISKMVEAANQQQMHEFQEAAHKLKGAASSVGLLWVQNQAKDYEQAETQHWAGMEPQLLQFQQKIEEHLLILQEYIDNFAQS
jgi:two-component system aerobic respiration control sensor histidine kinase ArcB